MGKQPQHKYSSISLEKSPPGCLWNIIHILHHNHLHHIKKMLPHRKYGGKRHPVGVQFTGSNLTDFNADTMHEQDDAKSYQSSAEERISLSSSAPSKNSLRARIKARIVEEVSKKKEKHRRSLTCPAPSQMRHCSLHHQRPSDHDHLREIISEAQSPKTVHRETECSTSFTWKLSPPNVSETERPIIVNKNCEICSTTLDKENDQVIDMSGEELDKNDKLFHDELDKAMQALLEKKLIYVKEHTHDAPLYQSKEFLDALGLANVNKELFYKVFEEHHHPGSYKYHGRKSFSSKVGLTKCVSFPVAGSSGGKGFGPIEHMNKLKEIGGHLKKEGKFQLSDDVLSFIDSKSSDSLEKPMPLTAQDKDGNVNLGQAMPETIKDDSLGSSSHWVKDGSKDEVVIKQSKSLKQKIKHVIRENRRERQRIAMDAVLHKVPYGSKPPDVDKEISNQSKESPMNGEGSPASHHGNDYSTPSFSKAKLQCIRSSPSLFDSLDKYCQLYDWSSDREVKCRTPGRINLSTEGNLLGKSTPKFLGRILSLPELKSYNYNYTLLEDSSVSFRSEEPIMENVGNMACDESSMNKQKRIYLPGVSEDHMQLRSSVESGNQERLHENTEVVSSIEDMRDPPLVSLVYDLGNLDVLNKPSQSKQELESSGDFPDNQGELSPSSVADSNLEGHLALSPDFTISDESPSRKKQESLHSHQEEDDDLLVRVDAKDKPEFDYVEEVLKLSGFSTNELLGTWHATEQPLDPLIFEEIEGCSLPHEEAISSNHLVLFDVINEVLMEIYENSFSYCPKPLSSLSHFRPMPVGYHVLEEVWGNISWCLSSRPELNPSLDYLVSRDLRRNGGWMNLQFDTEAVGLEVEDLIFDDLVEEMICS